MTNLLYGRAQTAITELKSCIYEILVVAGQKGITNAEIGKQLGIYAGHIRHQGHIPRTLLALMEMEGVAIQDKDTKKWRVFMPKESSVS